ncbi:unnamed protein product [Parajaminaea phylloscopi]
MSASQRIIPLLAVSVVGVATGIYVFDPLLKQYAQDTGGTFRPKDASSSTNAGKDGSSSARADASPSPSAALKGIIGTDETRRAEDIRNKAALNAASRATEAAQSRAEKTGDGKVL